MVIRRAVAGDAVGITHCLMLAMEAIIFRMIGERSADKAYQFLLHFVAIPHNQYSYECCWVAVQNGIVVAAANVYDGGQLTGLRQPIVDHLKRLYAFNMQLENETEAGEYYIDSLGVLAGYQHKGIGGALLTFLINEFVGRRQKTLGLLVDEDNHKAKALYERKGFTMVGTKSLLGKQYHHLQHH